MSADRKSVCYQGLDSCLVWAKDSSLNKDFQFYLNCAQHTVLELLSKLLVKKLLSKLTILFASDQETPQPVSHYLTFAVGNF